MNRKQSWFFASVALAGAISLGPATAPAGSTAAVAAGGAANYHFIREIPIGGEGGWDYLSIDSAARRLYVAHATQVVVVDLDRSAVIGSIPDTPGIHGVAVAPELGRGFTSNGQESRSSVVDLRSLKTLFKVATGAGPDAILFDPGRQEIYTFNGRGKSATVIDARTNQVVATVILPGKPEFAVADPDASRIYANIEDQSEVVAIDNMAHRIVATWPIAPGVEPSGLALDAAHHRLFIGCHNELMVMMDSATGRVLATVPIGRGVDANAFDPATGLAFASCGDGTVTIAREDAPGHLVVVQTLPTEAGARTLALDPATHRIYLATAKFGPLPESPAGGRRRPPVVPGTFKVLVYGTD